MSMPAAWREFSLFRIGAIFLEESLEMVLFGHLKEIALVDDTIDSV